MIEINLIPAGSRKKSGGGMSAVAVNIPQEILWGVGGGVILLLVLVHLILGGLWVVAEGHLTLDKGQWQKVASDRKELDAISDESKGYKKKMTMIADMAPKSTQVWSQKLNAISDGITRGVWLRKMVLDKAGLTMEGSAVSKSHDEITNVGNFVAALKKDEGFMSGFASLEVNSIQRGKRSAMEVTDFTVTAKLK